MEFVKLRVNYLISDFIFVNITMNYHYFGWIRSFLDPHFLVFAYNKSGTLYPDSSFIKVRFPLCSVDLRFLYHQGVIGRKKKNAFYPTELLGSQKPKCNVVTTFHIWNSGNSYPKRSFNPSEVLREVWERKKVGYGAKNKKPLNTEPF